MSDIGPQRATPKSLSALKAEINQQDIYIMPKPEEIEIFQDKRDIPSSGYACFHPSSILKCDF